MFTAFIFFSLLSIFLFIAYLTSRLFSTVQREASSADWARAIKLTKLQKKELEQSYYGR